MIMAITLGLMLGFGFLPPVMDITAEGMRVLGVFLGCIFAWVFGEIIWSSVLSLVILTLFGFGTMGSNFANAFGNQTVGLLFCCVIFCYAVQQSGLLTEIASYITSCRWAQKNIWSLIAAFFIASTILGMLVVNSLPAIIIMWTLFYEVADQLGLRPYEKLTSIMLIGIAITAFAGTVIMPYSAMAIIVKGYAVAFDPALNFSNMGYFAINFVICCLFIIALLLVLKYIVRPPVNIQMIKREPYKIRFDQKKKWVAFYLFILIFFMMVPSMLPSGNILHEIFANSLGSFGVILLIPVLMALTRIDGEPLLDINDALKNGVPFPLAFLVAGAMNISGYLTTDSTGIVPSLTGFLGPLIEGHAIIFVMIFFVVAGLLLTNFVNDVIAGAIIISIAAPFVLGGHGNLVLFIALLVPAVNQGCFMPSGSPVGALMHGNSDWLRSKDVFKYVAVMELVLMVVLMLVTYVCVTMGL